jgi:glutathione peroxidase
MKYLRTINSLALISALALGATSAMAAPAAAKKGNEMTLLYTTPVKTIDGKETNLSEHKGQVLLIVNTASECGYTPQYKGLEALYEKYKAQGLVVLGFPSNDFGGQEPGSEGEIKKFCELKYKTTFPMYSKVGVKENPHPLFALLQKDAGALVGWNFGKFLVSRTGTVKQYFPSKVEPESKELEAAVEGALKEGK